MPIFAGGYIAQNRTKSYFFEILIFLNFLLLALISRLGFKVVFHSPLRGDRDGAQIHDELFALSFCLEHNLIYAGPIGLNAEASNAELRYNIGLPFSLLPRHHIRASLLPRFYRPSSLPRASLRDALKYPIRLSMYKLPRVFLDKNLPSFTLEAEVISNSKKYLESSSTYLRDIAVKKSRVIVMHIRRGDVANDSSDRFIPLEAYLRIINSIKAIRPGLHFIIHSQSLGWTKDELGQVSRLGCELKLDANLKDAWNDMICAEILFSSKSSFSYVPAIFCKGLVFSPLFWHANLPNWISYSHEDLFNDYILEHQIVGNAMKHLRLK